MCFFAHKVGTRKLIRDELVPPMVKRIVPGDPRAGLAAGPRGLRWKIPWVGRSPCKIMAETMGKAWNIMKNHGKMIRHMGKTMQNHETYGRNHGKSWKNHRTIPELDMEVV